MVHDGELLALESGIGRRQSIVRTKGAIGFFIRMNFVLER